MEVDLSLISASDLINELDKRFDDIVILSSKRLGGDREHFDGHWNGNIATLIGLCHMFISQREKEMGFRDKEEFGI